ncbi:MAG: hypothetical protein ACLU38_09275 [Dysosmobacter sp.]
MHGTTIDRRVKKTKKQLRLALMHLMTQKSAKSISVRELAEQADINRATTFYISTIRTSTTCSASGGWDGGASVRALSAAIPRTP